MNRKGYRCRPCCHGKAGSCKGQYRKHGCATTNPKRSVR